MFDVQGLSMVVAGVLGGIGLWWSRRALKRAGVGNSQVDAITNLQLLADTWEERFNLEHEDRVKAELAVTQITAERDALSRLLERRRSLHDPRHEA